jgi:cysteine-rich repeat protein
MREPRACSDALSLDAVAERTGPSSWHYVFAREDATHVPFRGDDCGRYGDNAVLLEMTPASDGALIVEPTGSSNSPISILAACDDAFSTLACIGRDGTSARVRAGERVYIQIHPGDPPYDFSIRLEPFVAEGGACDYFHTAVCGPPLVCADLACADACGDGDVDTGERCDDGNRETGDGCAPDCTLEPQPLPPTACGAAPTTLVFVPGRDGARVALAEGDTSLSTTRDPSCTTAADASPTLFFAFPMADGDRALVDALGEDGFAPKLRPVAGACGPMISCDLGPSAPGGFDTLTFDVRGTPHTIAVSGTRGPGDQGHVRILVRLCEAGVTGCYL